ncbi:N-acetylglucosamine kinase [uncultured Fibrella sp.]|uniref:N-acetylglucosamine kinase n=1 Tax=uncultured Fibrella sp. TaxID=1284596 RepID=UPI0035CBFC03
MMSILIADSGSTKTEWRLIRPGQPSIAIHTDGLNPYFQNQEQLQQTLLAQLAPQLPALTEPVSVHFYGTGCTGPASNDRMASALQTILPTATTIDVASDMLGAAKGAAGHEPGIVCILGTGSNACFFDGQQLTTPSYSLGFWLGDEGSGGNLGKRLVTAFLHGKLPADLHAAFAAQFNLDRLTVLDHAYNQPYPNRYFASFTPFLSAHRQSAFVRELVLSAFSDFLQLYIRRLPEYDRHPIHFVGSVAYYFSDWLQELLIHNHLQTGRFVKAPIDGLVAYHS